MDLLSIKSFGYEKQEKQMFQRNNILIIGSTGRNNGKTEFACRLIGNLSEKREVIGVKITTIKEDGGKCPRGEKGCGICGTLTQPYDLITETCRDSGKDTARMLNAGAKKVYWLRVHKRYLKEGINELLKNIPENTVVVCESNSSRLELEPGLFLVIRNPHENTIKQSCAEVYHFADKIIYFNGRGWDFEPAKIDFRNGRWAMKENATAVILAGGRSSRMGEDKSLMKINNQPLISVIAKQLDNVFGEILIGANNEEKYRFLNRRIIPDIEKGKGPLMGILSCLKASQSEINFFTACDIPLMNTDFIKEMSEVGRYYDAVVPVSDNGRKPETLFAVYNRRLINVIEETLKDGKTRITDFFDKANVHFIPMKNKEWYYNLNTKENYYCYLEDRRGLRFATRIEQNPKNKEVFK